MPPGLRARSASAVNCRAASMPLMCSSTWSAYTTSALVSAIGMGGVQASITFSPFFRSTSIRSGLASTAV